MARILVVDDKETICSLFQRILPEDEVFTAGDGAQGLALLSANPQMDLIISDIRMPNIDGMTFLQEVKRYYPEIEVILMTAYAEVESAVTAMKAGAFDYIVKPFDPDDALLTIQKVLEIQKLRQQTSKLQQELNQIKGFGVFVGESAKMQKIYALIEKAASSSVNVLLTGESGTGKELVARLIHEQSLRKTNAFVAVNCGALPAELAESELFGHTRGAFTGAISDKAGLIEEAHQGTLFLDEINSLPLHLQVKLNRILEGQEGRRLGSNKSYQVNVRFIAATNVPLIHEVQEGHFREDLYFRLNVLQIQLPPLRDRKEDIPTLAKSFLEKTPRGKFLKGFSPEVLKTLISYHWPGNVRELKNMIESAATLSESEWILPSDLPLTISSQSSPQIPPEYLALFSYQDILNLARDQMVKQYLLALMRTFKGNVTAAASRADIERETLHRLLKKQEIKPADFRNSS